MLKGIILTLSIFLFISCSRKDKLIYYSYNNISITRLDNGNEIRFYLGKFSNPKLLPQSYIRCTYKGFDGFVDGFIEFEESGVVSLIRYGGLFEEVNTNAKFKIKTFEHMSDFKTWSERIKDNYKNIYRISELPSAEIEENKKKHTDVKAVYTNI